jgi:hypothetical protein
VTWLPILDSILRSDRLDAQASVNWVKYHLPFFKEQVHAWSKSAADLTIEELVDREEPRDG